MGLIRGTEESTTAMRATLFSVLLALPAAEAAAAEVSVGVALAGNLSIGQSSSSEIAARQSETIGGGGIRVPVRVVASELATLRITPRFDYYQLDHTVALGENAEADLCADYAPQRLPGSGIMGGATLGGEVSLLQRESVRVYAAGDAGIGLGKTTLRWFYFDDDTESGECFRLQLDPGAEVGTDVPNQRVVGLFGVAELGVGLGMGPMRVELSYARVAFPSGKPWQNSVSSAAVTAEALSTLQLTVGVAFGG